MAQIELNRTQTGIVYILINEAMPGYIKIGFTEGELIKRIKALDTTSVPLPFECFYAAKVSDCKKVERLIHDAFDDHRVRTSREFFIINPERVRSAIQLANPEDITPREAQLIETNEDKQAIEKTRKRRENFTFGMLGIPAGATLTFLKDNNRTCTVLDHKKVEMDGEVMSVSGSALKVLRDLGYDWPTVSGWGYWCYNGKVLTELFSEIEV
jgi:hypothetical protein